MPSKFNCEVIARSRTKVDVLVSDASDTAVVILAEHASDLAYVNIICRVRIANFVEIDCTCKLKINYGSLGNWYIYQSNRAGQ